MAESEASLSVGKAIDEWVRLASAGTAIPLEKAERLMAAIQDGKSGNAALPIVVAPSAPDDMASGDKAFAAVAEPPPVIITPPPPRAPAPLTAPVPPSQPAPAAAPAKVPPAAPALPAVEPAKLPMLYRDLSPDVRTNLYDASASVANHLDEQVAALADRIQKYLLALNGSGLLLVMYEAGTMLTRGIPAKGLWLGAGGFAVGLGYAGLGLGWTWTHLMRRLGRFQDKRRMFFANQMSVAEFTGAPESSAVALNRWFFAASFAAFLLGAVFAVDAILTLTPPPPLVLAGQSPPQVPSPPAPVPTTTAVPMAVPAMALAGPVEPGGSVRPPAPRPLAGEVATPAKAHSHHAVKPSKKRRKRLYRTITSPAHQGGAPAASAAPPGVAAPVAPPPGPNGGVP